MTELVEKLKNNKVLEKEEFVHLLQNRNETIADILKNEADAFFSCPDWVAAEGMRLLAQHGITSGESGAPGAGLVQRLLIDPALAEMKTAIGLTEESRVLLFRTEGDTDRGRYREIMAGAWPAPELE